MTDKGYSQIKFCYAIGLCGMTTNVSLLSIFEYVERVVWPTGFFARPIMQHFAIVLLYLTHLKYDCYI